MGHAHHFLSRLDRLTRPHVELALALYRDDERLRYVLEQAHLPERAERVAVSLDDPHEGPFVLVTRSGRFVTCLGRGMRASDLPVISRAELDAISARRTMWQEREAVRKQLAPDYSEAGFLFGRLLDAGPHLAREELQALAALHPLLADLYFDVAMEWTINSRQIQLNLKSALKKRGPRLRPDQLEALHVYWKTFFAAGHLAVLSVADGGERLRERARGDDAQLEVLSNGLTAAVVDGAILSKTVRGAWALGQLGEAWIPHAQKRFTTAAQPAEVLGPALALLAIGTRHEGVRDEVIEIFRAVPTLANEAAQGWARYLCECGVTLLSDVERALDDQRRLGAGIAHDLRVNYPPGSPHHYAREEDVPDDIAYSEPFQLIAELGRDPKMLAIGITMVVPAALATPEQLYLPRRCVEFLEPKWEPEDALMIMEGWLEEAKKPAPRPAGPARKSACPCGSGKKYKRCCEPTQAA